MPQAPAAANPFDQASRYLAKLTPAAFLAWLLRLPPDGLQFAGWLDARQARFPGEPDRTCDTVARLADPAANGQPWAVPVEFQIQPDPDMFSRLLVYLGLVRLTERPTDLPGDRYQVGAVVVNLTGRGDGSRDLAWPAAGLGTQLQLVERNLAQEEAAATLAAVATGAAPGPVLALIPLMNGGDAAAVQEHWKVVAQVLPSARQRADAGGLALVFAEAAGRWPAWQQSLEGWNVTQSQQVLEWQRQARDEGRKEGRDEGRKEGKDEEKTRGIQAAYRMALKFTGSDAAALAAVVEQFGEEARAILAKAMGKAPE